MARQAPLHLERRILVGQRHIVDLAMAGRAAYALVHVNAVIEINVVREVMNPGPLDRLSRLPTLPHGLEIRTVRPDLGMTVHTGLCRRNTGRGGLFHRSVAIPAVDAVVADMMFVAELNRLFAIYKGPCIPGRTIHFGERPYSGRQNEDGSENGHPRKGISAVMKDLWHRSVCRLTLFGAPFNKLYKIDLLRAG